MTASSSSADASTPCSAAMYARCSRTLRSSYSTGSSGMKLVAARAGEAPAAAPAISIDPSVNSSVPAASRRNVDLPEPLWPTSATSSPRPIARSSGASATRSPYAFVAPSVTSMGSAIGDLGFAARRHRRVHLPPPPHVDLLALAHPTAHQHEQHEH